MKGKKIKNLIFFLISVACYFLLIWQIFTIKLNSIYDVLYYIIAALDTIPVSIIVNVFLHEIGHLLFGLISGLKLVSIKILWLKLSFEKKVKISLEKAYDFGETVFIPRNDKNVSGKMAFSIIGGLISTIFLFVRCLLSYDITRIITASFTEFSFAAFIIITIELLYAGHVVFPLYMLLVNLFGDETCDGRRLLSLLKVKNNNKKIASNAIYVSSLIYKGVSITEIDPKYFEYYNEDYSIYSSTIIYYKYLSLISVDKESAINTILKLSNTSKIKDSVFDAIMCELYYVALLNEDSEFLQNNKQYIENIVEYNHNLYAIRAHAVLRIHNGDTEWANILIDQGLNEIISLKTGGTILVEKCLLEDLKARLS